MEKQIDWDKVMREFEKNEKLADEVSAQIQEERSIKTTVEDDIKLMERVETEIKENKLDALEIKYKGQKK